MVFARPILVVEDDADLLDVLIAHLEFDGQFAAIGVGTLAEASEKLSAHGAWYDALLLDVRLPDGDGRSFCATLRREGHQMPIILLTGMDGEDNVVRGLDSGANDYISKPFRISELMARLRAQLRVFENSEHAVFPVGPFIFRPAAKLLHDEVRNRRIRLTEKETLILKLLYRAGRSAVARDVLLNEVWGYRAVVTTHTLETHIYRLRQKIEPDPANARILLTERGGYRLDPTAISPPGSLDRRVPLNVQRISENVA
jgi:DNA-binding response OmpR family regulator